MINDVKLIYITCGFLRLICSVLLTVCSHFKVNLSIGQFISFQKEQRLLPVFPLLNATVRIIEPLATTFSKELLSNRPLVRLQSGTYKRHESKDLWRFFFQKSMREYKLHKYKFLLIGLELLYHLLLIKSMCLLIRKLANSVLISYWAKSCASVLASSGDFFSCSIKLLMSISAFSGFSFGRGGLYLLRSGLA